MGKSFIKVHQDNTTSPDESAATTFNISQPVAAGGLQRLGLNFKGTTASAPHAANFWGLVKSLKIIYNGRQVFFANDLAAVNTLTTIPRTLALVEDIGGYPVSNGSATAHDEWLWIPLNINLPANSRLELQISWIVGAAAITSPEFSVWHEYGPLADSVLVGNPTTQTMPAGSQAQVVVKLPAIPGAVCSGVQISSTTATDDLVDATILPLGNFSMVPQMLRALGGRTEGGDLYEYDDAGTLVQTTGQGSGQVFVPLYGYASSDASVTFLVTATTSEVYQFIPVMSIPASGNGERMGTQTLSTKVSAASDIVDRSE